jgi:hypothetical protein
MAAGWRVTGRQEKGGGEDSARAAVVANRRTGDDRFDQRARQYSYQLVDVGTGDYNGDGKSDLLWRDAGGNTAIWFMNGATIASTAVIGDMGRGSLGPVARSIPAHSRPLFASFFRRGIFCF